MSATVLYGKRELVGIYVDGKLVATHDKFTKNNGDLEREIKKLEDAGHEVQEANGDFQRFSQIPAEYQTGAPVESKEPGPKQSENKPGEVNASQGTMKGQGEVKRGTLSRNK